MPQTQSGTGSSRPSRSSERRSIGGVPSAAPMTHSAAIDQSQLPHGRRAARPVGVLRRLRQLQGCQHARSHSPLRQLQGWRHPSRHLPKHPCSPFTRRTGRTRRNPSRAEPVPKRRRLRQLQGWSRSQCERDPVDSPSRRALHAFSARWPLQRRQLAWRPPCPVASIKPPPHRLRPD